MTAGALNSAQLHAAMTELLPGITQEALAAWEAFVTDMSGSSTLAAAQMRGELYAEMLLIEQEYGSELATALFNMGERHVINTFELSGAAEMLSGGADEETVYDEITRFGWHPTDTHQERVQLILRNLI